MLVRSAALTAVTITLVDNVTAGAVRVPLREIVPALVCHMTLVSLLPDKVATNCCVEPDWIVTVEGERLILMFATGDGLTGLTGDVEIPLQAVRMPANAERRKTPNCLGKLVNVLLRG